MSLVSTLLNEISKLRVLVKASQAGLSKVTCSHKSFKVDLGESIDLIRTLSVLLIESFESLLWRMEQITKV